MKRIYKYPCPVSADSVKVAMPHAAATLCVQVQHGIPCIWAIADTDDFNVDRPFRWVGTGHSADDIVGCSYIGTIQLDGGQFIFHLFEG